MILNSFTKGPIKFNHYIKIRLGTDKYNESYRYQNYLST